LRRESRCCDLCGTVVRSQFEFRRLTFVFDGLFAGVNGDNCLVVWRFLRGILGQSFDERLAVEPEEVEFVAEIPEPSFEGFTRRTVLVAAVARDGEVTW